MSKKTYNNIMAYADKIKNIKNLSKKYWWIILISGVFLLLIIVLKYKLNLSLENIVNISAVFTGFLAVLSLIFTALKLEEQRKQQKENLEWQKIQLDTLIKQEKIRQSWDCLKLYMEPDNREIISSAHRFLRLKKIKIEEKLALLIPTAEDLENKIKKGEIKVGFLLKATHCLNLSYQEMKEIEDEEKCQKFMKNHGLFYLNEIRSRVIFLQNLFEAIGTLYNKDQLDKPIIKNFLEAVSSRAYKGSTEVIEERKKENNENQPTLFKEWKNMNKDFEEGET